MHSETNFLDFINHDCLSNDVTVAALKAALSDLETNLPDETITDIDLENRDYLARRYTQAKQFLCHA